MNIALFASAFYPSLGGVEELCRQLAMELMRQGHGVIVLTNRWPRDLPATETLDGVPVFRLPFRLPEGSAKAAINYHLTHHRIERELLTILRSHKIDLLHVQCVSSNARYAMIAQETLNLPLVVTLQGELTMDANQIFQKSPQAREILRQSLDRADVITACSGKTLRDGEEFYGKPFGDRGRVIFNGVNLADFAALRFNDQRSMINDQKMGDDDGFTTKARRHEGPAENPQISQIPQINDGGGQASRQVYPAGPIEIAALNGQKRGSPKTLISDPCSLVTEPQGRPYIFALGRMAKQKGFDVLIRAYGALRFNDHGSMNNDQKLGDDDGLTTKTQRHEGRRLATETTEIPEITEADNPPIAQISQITGLAGPIESAALNGQKRGSPKTLISDPCSLVTEPQGRPYIFALGRMAKQKGFDVLIRAYGALRFNDHGSRINDQNLGNDAGGALRFNDQRAMINDQKLGDDEPPAAHLAADAGLQVTGYRLQGTDRPQISQIAQITGLAGPTESVALPENSKFQVPGSDFLPTLVIAGDGPELENLKVLVSELGLVDRVHFPGRADRQQVAAYLSGCEFFVLSSRADEGLPVVCAEAMGAGCAIVATRSGGAPEAVLDGQTGLLVDKENVEQLAAAMQRLMADSQLRKQLAAAGKARAAEFAWPKVAGQYAEAYVAAALQ